MIKNVSILPNPKYDADIQLMETQGGISTYKLTVRSITDEKPDKLSLRFSTDSDGTFSVWNPGCQFNRALWPNWKKNRHASRITSGAPVQAVIGMDGKNKITISVLDVKTPIEVGTGISEEDAALCCAIDFFTLPVNRFDYYETVIRIDERSIPYYEALKAVGSWWEENSGFEKASIPEATRMPVYSTWYSFHQDIDVDYITEQCRLSKELGMESVIVDDGWQTDDNGRGYAYCGDWEVAPSKVGNMREFADKVHNAGLKFIIWFSVPFVGIHSGVWKRFESMMLKTPRMGCDCLDPRYKEVRDYLINIYVNAVKEWNLDGLKLDFIDSFVLSEDTPEYDERRDIVSLEDAVDVLLNDIKKALTQINPDICIEFRQSYTGPAVMSLGNMLRVGDCPADSIKNRVGSIDLRLLSGKTPVHSDMIMWDINGAAENAALQIINALFSVPQISVLIDKLPKAHYDMLKFYLDFWRQYRDVLLDGNLKAYNPEANYSLVSAENKGKIVAAAFSHNVLNIDEDYDEIVFVNGTGNKGLIINKKSGFKYTVTIKSCTGEILSHEAPISENGLNGFEVPPSGMLILEKIV